MPDASLDAAARDAVVAYADGDGRRLINLVEQLAVAATQAQAACARPGVRRGDDRPQPAPLRQGRRGVLRPDLGAAQVGARQRPRRRAVLAVPHARRRRRPALRRPAHDPHGHRGYRPRRSAGAAARARRGRNLRAAGHAGRRAGAGRSGDLSRLRGQEQRRLCRLRQGARVHRRGRLAAGAAVACATRRRG